MLEEFASAAAAGKDPLARDLFFLLPSAEHVDRITTQLFQSGMRGFFHRRVTTLSRLIPEVFGPGDEKVVSNMTRLLVLREILAQKEWPYLEQVRQMPGVLDLVSGLITELKDSLVDAAGFRKKMDALKKKEPLLKDKYETLAGIYEAYEKELKTRGLRDRQDDLKLFRQFREAGRAPRFKKIWLDGFFDFSPLQTEYLRELSELSEDITVSLTYDHAAPRTALFEPVQETLEMFEALGFDIVNPGGENRRAARPALAYLERHLFSDKKPDPKKAPAPEGVEFYEAVGVQGEVEMIAREILRMTRAGDYRFSDFAVLFRQVSGYESPIRSIFSRYGIPVEIHERERLKLSPLIQTVCSLLRIFRGGWKREDLLNFLKSSYVTSLAPGVPKTYEWPSELENRAFASGVWQGREAWMQDWTFGKKDDFNARKKKALESLCRLEDGLRNAGLFPEYKSILGHALRETFGVFKQPEASSDPVRRDAAAWKRFESLCEEVQKQMENASLPPGFDTFADQFLRLVELDLYSLHDRSKNRVQIYGVSLARQKEYRIVFVAGMLERGFPVRVKEDPILADWERRAGGLLRERLPRQNMERYLFYVAATRAKERLVLTCPKLDFEGKEALPSFYFEEVRALFGKEIPVKKQDLAHPYTSAYEAISPRELENAVVGDLWHADPYLAADPGLIYGLFSVLFGAPEKKARLESVLAEISARLTDKEILDNDYLNSERTSATALEEYGKCAFKYFAGRILQLQDPQEEVNLKIKGIVRHFVLENYFKKRIERKMSWEESRKFVVEELPKALAKHPLVINKKYQYELDVEELEEMLLNFLEAELKRLETTPFQPVKVEFAFGTRFNPDAPAFEMEDGGRKFRVVGKIDRIDADPATGRALVLDYKPTAKAVNKDMEAGVSLQLPLYAQVVEKYLKMKSVGAHLLAVSNGATAGFYLKEMSEGTGGPARSQMSDEEFKAVLDRSLFFIRRFTAGMKKGEIHVLPRRCEDHCPYPAVCRVEKWRLKMIQQEITEEDQKWLEKSKSAK